MSNHNVIRKRLRDTERVNCCGTCTLTYDNTANGGVVTNVVYAMESLIRIDEYGTMYYWNTSQDGAGTMYKSGDLLLMNRNLTLYGGNTVRSIFYYFGNTLLRKADYFLGATAYIIDPPNTGDYKWTVDLNDVNGISFNAQDVVAMTTNINLYVAYRFANILIDRFQVIYYTNNPNASGEEYDGVRYFLDENFTTRDGSNIYDPYATFVAWVDVTGLYVYLPNTVYKMTLRIATYGLYARYEFSERITYN